MRSLQTSLLFSFILLGLVGFHQPAHSQVRFELKAPDGRDVNITGVNQKREDNVMLLYTPAYGQSTRTNPYGVEVQAVPVPGTPNHYKVQSVTNVWDCQKDNNLNACGNMAIPPNGIVLSASGKERSNLMAKFPQGSEFDLAQNYSSESRLHVDATNPTPENNPGGAGFPGYRGGNQMVVYTTDYGQPQTGTNEFGYEVTVVDGRVVRAEGANSSIPPEPGAFVLSGHGRARSWLLANAPIGAKITLETVPSDDPLAPAQYMLISDIDRDTYLYQLQQNVDRVKSLGNSIPPALNQEIEQLKHEALGLPDEEVAKRATVLTERLKPVLWASYPQVFANQQIRGVWHRPSENTVQKVQQSLDRLKASGFNTVFLETYLHGEPIFPSQTFQLYGIAQRYPFELQNGPKDLLRVWLDEAHKRNMKVHVWFQTFYAANRQYEPDLGPIIKAHPDWANVQKSGLDKDTLPPSTLEAGGYFLDPANPEVQQFLLSLIHEVTTRYDVDGFQLDYIRYPASFPPDRYSYVATTWGYTPYARQTFTALNGVDPAEIDPQSQPEQWTAWNNFKTQAVDNFVRKVHDQVKTERPNLLLSAAVFPKAAESLSRKHQNWPVWAKQHWVDFLAPMTLTSSLDVIATDTRFMEDTTGLPVVTGIFGPFNGNSASEVVEQVWSAKNSGANGVILFETSHLTDNMLQALHAGLFKSQNMRSQ